jgi:CRP/FNR family transcriptional regulator, dissimilatory nitrate respiration regulator
MRDSDKKIEDLLGESVIFSQLPGHMLSKVASTASITRFSDKELLFNAGNIAAGFYIITAGRVEVFRSSENGRKQVLHIIEEGETLGEVPLFEGGRYPASAAALGEVEAIRISGEKFMSVALDNPQILLEMLAVLSLRLRRFVNLIDDLSLKDVSSRLMGYFERQADKNGKLVLDCTKAELANRLGTIPETLSRALNKLKSDGIIEIEQNTITLQTTY